VTRQQLRVADGRRIDYLEFGDPAGVPAVYLHGTPSSASEARWLHGAARAQGVRLVSLDRPGYLRSEPHAGASFIGVAQDVVAVARALQLGRFAVVGFSGGAGYALATAHVSPDQVTVVHVGGGIGSLAGDGWQDLAWPRRLAFRLITRAPAVSGLVLAAVFRLLRRGLQKRLDSPAEAALWFFEGPAQGAQIAAIAEYVRTSAPEELRSELTDWAAGTSATSAIIDDLVAYVRPWPFELSSFSTRVEIWHGLDDPAAPVGFAERTASELANAEAHLFDGEGHFVLHTHGEAIATSIREHAQGLNVAPPYSSSRDAGP
jgi:pimeloyl-ACP methyl ester carboxylesterase